MTALKLMEAKPRKENPRAILIDLFNKKYESELGEPNPFPFGAAMRAMLHFRYVDEETGEEFNILPTPEAWSKELDGFFLDDFARDERHFHFTYFIKQFGSFAKRVRVKRKSVSSYVQELETCPVCLADYLKGTVHTCPR